MQITKILSIVGAALTGAGDEMRQPEQEPESFGMVPYLMVVGLVALAGYCYFELEHLRGVVNRNAEASNKKFAEQDVQMRDIVNYANTIVGRVQKPGN